MSDRNNVTNLDSIEEIKVSSEDEFIETVRDKLISLALVEIREKKKEFLALHTEVSKLYKYNGTEYKAELKLHCTEGDIWYRYLIRDSEPDGLKYDSIKSMDIKDI